MMHDVLVLGVALATVWAGLMAGVYGAFSGFIMQSLDELGAAPAAEAMNAVNRVILHSWFIVVFFTSTLLYLLLAMAALLMDDLAGRGWLLAAAWIYLLGMFGCTVACNVPLNHRLAGRRDGNGEGIAWAEYLQRWTRWNHLRSVSSLAALALGVYYLVAHA